MANREQNVDQSLIDLLRGALASSTVQIKLTTFDTTDPELWFAETERDFASSNLTSESEKFKLMSKMLDSQVKSELRDIRFNPPHENQFTTFKMEILKRMCSSQEEKTRMLLESQDIGDRKPSQFLRHLRSLAGKTVSDAVIRTLWSSRLPASMQPILAMQMNESLDKVAEMADHLHDFGKPRPVIAEASSATDNLLEKLTQVLTSMDLKMTK